MKQLKFLVEFEDLILETRPEAVQEWLEYILTARYHNVKVTWV